MPKTLTCGSSCASGGSPSWTVGTNSATSVAGCQGDTCIVISAYSNYFSISPTGSTLTINSVSRSIPFNMETRWTCQCGGPQNTDTVCGELQIYGQSLFSPIVNYIAAFLFLTQHFSCTVDIIKLFTFNSVSVMVFKITSFSLYFHELFRYHQLINGLNSSDYIGDQ